jgi:hypothetical protein
MKVSGQVTKYYSRPGFELCIIQMLYRWSKPLDHKERCSIIAFEGVLFTNLALFGFFLSRRERRPLCVDVVSICPLRERILMNCVIR